MNINTDYRASIIPLLPWGTNSTMFTDCCGCAICANERYCPSCGREVIGCNAETNHERQNIRWAHATAGWGKRNKRK
jgi:hypothetical protein